MRCHHWYVGVRQSLLCRVVESPHHSVYCVTGYLAGLLRMHSSKVCNNNHLP